MSNANRDESKWFDFHNDYGHAPTEYRDLKDNFKDLVRRGYYSQLKARSQREVTHNQDNKLFDATEPKEGNNKKGTINVISGRIPNEKSKVKAHVRSLSCECMHQKCVPCQ